MFKFLKISQAYAQTSPEELVGDIEVPQGVDLLNEQTGVEGGIGIIIFISNLIRFFTIVGGIWIVINIVFAAYQYITGGGKADSHTKVRDRLTMSVVGLLLMIAAYTVAAIIGLVFYNDAGYILSPKIEAII